MVNSTKKSKINKKKEDLSDVRIPRVGGQPPTMEEGEISGAGGGGDELYNALHQRLVASGEWAKLSTLLKRMLDECGWETTFQDHAAAQARAQPTTLSLPNLIDQLVPHAKGT